MRHKTEPGSLLAGLLFCTFGVLYILAKGNDWSLPWLWLLPALFICLGIAGIAGLVTRNNRR